MTLDNGQIITGAKGYSCIWGALRDPENTEMPMLLSKVPHNFEGDLPEGQRPRSADQLEAIIQVMDCTGHERNDHEDYILAMAKGQETARQRVQGALRMHHNDDTIHGRVTGHVLKQASFLETFALEDQGFTPAVQIVQPPSAEPR